MRKLTGFRCLIARCCPSFVLENPLFMRKNSVKSSCPKDCNCQRTKQIYELLQKMYDSCYEKSDKSRGADFWEEIIIQGTGEKLSSIRKF